MIPPKRSPGNGGAQVPAGPRPLAPHVAAQLQRHSPGPPGARPGGHRPNSAGLPVQASPDPSAGRTPAPHVQAALRHSPAAPPVRAHLSPATIQKADSGEKGQRDIAREEACSCPEGTVGSTICSNFSKWYVKMIGNTASGKVGDYYKSKRTQLRQPATDENIDQWADEETEFFDKQDFTTRMLAKTLSKEDRAKLMKAARDRKI